VLFKIGIHTTKLEGVNMKDGHYVGSVVFGNTTIELRGYNGEREYAYIGDHDITEMCNELDCWEKFEYELYAQKGRNGTR